MHLRLLLVIGIVCLLVFLYLYITTYDDDNENCFTDFANVNDIEKFTNHLINYARGNHYHNRAIGTANPHYKPGDTVKIKIEGDDSFVKTVQNALKTAAAPYINLDLVVTNDSDAPFTIKQGSPPPGYTGYATNIGGKSCTMTLGNQRQLNIIHELGHCLGLYHENENKRGRILKALEIAEDVHGKEVATYIKNRVFNAVGNGKNATPFDKFSAMGIGNEFSRSQDYSDGDKLWYKNTYGVPGSGKDGKPGW